MKICDATYEYKAAVKKQAAGRADLGQEATNKTAADRKATTAAENAMGAKRATAGKKGSRCQTKGKQAPGEKQTVEQIAAEKAAIWLRDHSGRMQGWESVC